MRVWLQWGALLVAAVLAGAVLSYLYVCGPGLTGQMRADAPGAPAAMGEPPGAEGPTAPAAGSIRLGWTAWADAEVVSLMAERLLERQGYRVERVMTDIGVQYQAVADRNLDLMLMAWLPVTHSNYWEKVRDKVVNLGPLYTGRLGWAVPAYVPQEQLASIEDLTKPEVAQRLDGEIQGIDPGSGLMQASERAMAAYGLERLKLVSSSGAAMTAVLDRAVRRERWVVVTAWKPHWIFARYELRFLEDPKGILGGEERIHAIARRGFQEAFPPELTEFFSRMYLPEEELAQMLLDVQRSSVDEAVDRYIREHPRRIEYWLSGRIPESPAK